jgi:hypothetical protein
MRDVPPNPRPLTAVDAPGADHHDFSAGTGGHAAEDWNAEDVLTLGGWYASHVAALRSLRQDEPSAVVARPYGLPKNDYELGGATISARAPAAAVGRWVVTE